jgi:hypothetical protein
MNLINLYDTLANLMPMLMGMGEICPSGGATNPEPWLFFQQSFWKFFDAWFIFTKNSRDLRLILTIMTHTF